MKKLFTFFACLGLCFSIYAQDSHFTACPTSGQTSFYGLSISENGNFVVGLDKTTNKMASWNTITNEVIVSDNNDSSSELYAVNNQGIAVGMVYDDNYTSQAILFNCNDGSYTILEDDPNDLGSSAYGITEDGSTILGFHFDAAWITYACVWTDNGNVRTDLPWPTAAQVGFEFDYAAARWISSDGNTILGYVQDDASAEWVAIAWQRQNNEYVVNPFCNQFFQVLTYDDNYNPILPDTPNPYFVFEPTGLSANGEWVSLTTMPIYDVTDWDIEPHYVAARYNLNTNVLETLAIEDQDAPTLTDIDNFGNCVGYLSTEDYMTWSTTKDAIIWSISSTDYDMVKDIYTSDSFVNNWEESALHNTSGDGNKIVGYMQAPDGAITTFVLTRSNVGIEDYTITKEPTIKGIYDLTGRKLNRISTPGIYIIDGKKVYVR